MVFTLLVPEAGSLKVVLGGAAAMAAFGAYSFAGFALLLAGTEGAGYVADLSVSRSAARGLLVGGSFPTVGAVLTAGVLFPLELAELSWLTGFFGVLGAAGAAGLVAVAKKVARSEGGVRFLTGSPSSQSTEGGRLQ